MNRLVIATCLMVLSGCAAPPRPTPASPTYGSTSQVADKVALNDAAAKTKRDLEVARQKRQIAAMQDEIDALEKEIASLERLLASLEASINSPTGPNQDTPSSGSGGSGTVYTGPRGGQYTISPSGKKNYIKK